jgi:hypothetical protein
MVCGVPLRIDTFGFGGEPLTLRAPTPVGDFGLIYFEATAIDRIKARGRSNRAIDVHHPAARSANEVVVVVPHAVFVTRR